jgi:hypothetical protein
MSQEDVFHLPWRNIESSLDDDLLFAICDKVIAILILIAYITGKKPSIAEGYNSLG